MTLRQAQDRPLRQAQDRPLRQAQDEVRQGERESELKRGGEVASRLAHNQEIAGSSPARATIFGTVTGEGVAVRLSDPTAMLLKLVASHDGLTPASLIDRLVCARAEKIGLASLASAATQEADRPSGPSASARDGEAVAQVEPQDMPGSERGRNAPDTASDKAGQTTP